jgi:lysine biosynthesis protein LysW
MHAVCPECEARFEVGVKQARVGSLVECPECHTELEVISETPLEVTYLCQPQDDAWPAPADTSPRWL